MEVVKPPSRSDPEFQELEQHRKTVAEEGRAKGLILVFTGEGKGKTTSAIGTVMRAWGHGMSSAVVQFMKQAGTNYGEAAAGRKLGLNWEIVGDGWTWCSDDLNRSEYLARDGWELAKTLILQSEHDLVVLDEFTYPLVYGWLDISEVLSWIKCNKPENLHLLITGRCAPQELMDVADLVTEMREVKHPYKTQRQVAQKGIDF